MKKYVWLLWAEVSSGVRVLRYVYGTRKAAEHAVEKLTAAQDAAPPVASLPVRYWYECCEVLPYGAPRAT